MVVELGRLDGMDGLFNLKTLVEMSSGTLLHDPLSTALMRRHWRRAEVFDVVDGAVLGVISLLWQQGRDYVHRRVGHVTP